MLWYIHQKIMQNFNSIGYKYRYIVGLLWKACLCVPLVTWCIRFLVYYGLISIAWESFSENIIFNVVFKMLFCCFSFMPWKVCFYTPRGGFMEGKGWSTSWVSLCDLCWDSDWRLCTNRNCFSVNTDIILCYSSRI